MPEDAALSHISPLFRFPFAKRRDAAATCPTDNRQLFSSSAHHDQIP